MSSTYRSAVLANADLWVPACGGTETPFVASDGRTLLYVFNAYLGRHGYLDVLRDLVLSDEEVHHVLGLL